MEPMKDKIVCIMTVLSLIAFTITMSIAISILSSLKNETRQEGENVMILGVGPCNMKGMCRVFIAPTKDKCKKSSDSRKNMVEPDMAYLPMNGLQYCYVGEEIK